MSNVKVYLRDGRVIDISDLAPDAAIAKLYGEGVTPELIVHTVHRLERVTTSVRALSTTGNPTLEECMADAIERFGGKEDGRKVDSPSGE